MVWHSSFKLEFVYNIQTNVNRSVGIATNPGVDKIWIDLERTSDNKDGVRAQLNVTELDELITALMYARKLATGEAYEIS